MGHKRPLEVGNTLFDELQDSALAHVLELDGTRCPVQLGPASIGANIDLYVFIDGCIQGVHDGIGGLVSGIGVGLPVEQFDLVAEIEKKIDVGCAHSRMHEGILNALYTMSRSDETAYGGELPDEGTLILWNLFGARAFAGGLSESTGATGCGWIRLGGGGSRTSYAAECGSSEGGGGCAGLRGKLWRKTDDLPGAREESGEGAGGESEEAEGGLKTIGCHPGTPSGGYCADSGGERGILKGSYSSSCSEKDSNSGGKRWGV